MKCKIYNKSKLLKLPLFKCANHCLCGEKNYQTTENLPCDALEVFNLGTDASCLYCCFLFSVLMSGVEGDGVWLLSRASLLVD